MKSTLRLNSLALTVALALCGAAALAADTASPPPDTVPNDQLKREQAAIDLRIQAGMDQCNHAAARLATNDLQIKRMAVNNVVLGVIHLNVCKKKMVGHTDRIAALKRPWPLPVQSVRAKYMSNYVNYASRVVVLENRISALKKSLSPAEQALVNSYEDKLAEILKKADWEAETQVLENEVKFKFRDDDSLKGGAPATQPVADSGGQKLAGGYSVNADGTVCGPDGKPIPGAKLVNGRVTFPSGYAFDPATGTVFGPDGQAIPGARFDPISGRIILPGGYTFDPVTGTIYGPDGKPIPGARIENGRVVLPPTTGGGGQPTRTSTFTNPETGQSVTVDSEWFGEDGKLKPYKVKITYAGKLGGQINSEQKILREVSPAGNNTFSFREQPGENRQWALMINEGAGGKFQLENASGGPAAFTIEKWELTDAAGQVLKSATDQQFSADLPGSGRFTLKAYGKTDWKSPFLIEQSISK